MTDRDLSTDVPSHAQATPRVNSNVATSGLVRGGRSIERPPEQRPQGGTLDDVRAWLLGAARRIPETLELVDELCWRLVAAGLPLARVIVSLPTLHPQFLNTGYRWSLALGRCDEAMIAHGMRETEMFRNSPMRPVFEHGDTVRRRLVGPEAKLDFPILEELAAEGLTDYVALPLELSDGRRIAVTLATSQPDGFTAAEFAAVETLVPILAPLFEIRVVRGITRNLLDAYLGHETGRRVLAGEIIRGVGETIRAVVWFCDLRGFTRLSERLPGSMVIQFLDAYFERVVSAIHDRDGEVLKFLGDGIIAIFPVPDVELAPDAARRALDAARAALDAVDGLAGHPSLDGEAPPRLCVSLHLGDVIYGNIGAPDRLDFTVIGPAVNLVTRVDQLTKPLGRRLLVTDDFAGAYDGKLLSLGVHPIRGLASPHEIFTPEDVPPA